MLRSLVLVAISMCSTLLCGAQQQQQQKKHEVREIDACVYSIDKCTVLVTKHGEQFHLVGNDAETLKVNTAKTLVRLTATITNWPSGDKCHRPNVTPVIIKHAEITRMRCEQKQPQAITPCGDWSAWLNRMPGSSPAVHVKGSCTFPTGGYKVSLTPANPQGSNPAVLILQLKIVSPTGIVTQVVTTQDVTYSETTNKLFTDVHILPDKVSVPVKVTQ